MGQSRIENILQAMVDGSGTGELPTAQSRNEELLMRVCDNLEHFDPQSATEAAASAAEAESFATHAAAYADAAETAAEVAEVHAHYDTVGAANPVVCDYGAAGNATSAVVHMQATQDLHGYDKPWPAGGGSNLWPEYSTTTKDGVTLTNDGGKVVVNGGNADSDVWFDINVNHSVTADQIIYIAAFNPVASTSRMSLFVVTSSGNPQVNLQTVNAAYTDISTTARTVTKLRFRVPKGETYTNFVLYPYVQIGGNAPTSWSPYSHVCPINGETGVELTVKPDTSSAGTTYTATFPSEAGTVYGGTLDMVSGVLTVTHVKWSPPTNVVPDGTPYDVGNGYARIAYASQAKRPPYLAKDFGTYVGYYSHGLYDNIWATGYSHAYVNSNNPAYFWLPCEATAEAALAYIAAQAEAGTPLELVYEMATPITYTLTGQDISTFQGTNVVTSTNGTVTITLPIDIKKYIDEKIAALQALIT